MPAQIENARFCADYWGTFEIPGSDGWTTYKVEFTGGESPAYCSKMDGTPCPSYQFSKANNKDCKHIRQVWAQGCFWNPQWHGGSSKQIRPVSHHAPNLLERPESACPHCGGPTVAVRIAV
jgi:hypothetical protein